MLIGQSGEVLVSWQWLQVALHTVWPNPREWAIIAVAAIAPLFFVELANRGWNHETLEPYGIFTASLAARCRS
jgi:hypothetical protein